MSSSTQDKNYVIRHADDVLPVPCPCGQAKRIITAQDDAPASLHVTTIYDATRHYHKPSPKSTTSSKAKASSNSMVMNILLPPEAPS